MASVNVVGDEEVKTTWQVFIPVFTDGRGRRPVYSPTTREDALAARADLVEPFKSASWIEGVETTTKIIEVIR
jgi:hypothetical protein